MKVRKGAWPRVVAAVLIGMLGLSIVIDGYLSLTGNVRHLGAIAVGGALLWMADELTTGAFR